MRRVKAMAGDVEIANSADTIKIEGNYYFPPQDVKLDYLEDSDTHTVCHWKGDASYKTVVVGDKRFEDAVWYYPEPMEGAIERAGKFAGYFAFWRGVEVIEDVE